MIFSSKEALILVLRDKSEFLITVLYLVCIGLLVVLTFSSFSFPCFFHNFLGPSDDIEDSSFKWCCMPRHFFELIWSREILMLSKFEFIRGHASGHKKRLSFGSTWATWSESENKLLFQIWNPKPTKTTAPM